MSNYKSDIVNNAESGFLDLLEKEARSFIENTIAGVDYTHRTRNLYDSYGYAIYLNGKVLRSSTTSRTATKPKVWNGDKIFGNELMEEAFSKGGYKPSVSKGYVVVFGALMPYGEILEDGGGNLKRKYKVVAFMDDEARKFGEGVGLKGIVGNVKLSSYRLS